MEDKRAQTYLEKPEIYIFTQKDKGKVKELLPKSDRFILLKRIIQGIIFFGKYSTWGKFKNFCLLQMEYLIHRSYLKGKPSFITIETTTRCNLQCPFCPKKLSPTESQSGDMTLEGFKIIIDRFRDYIYLAVLHTFGEPLLNPDIYEMIKYAHSQKVGTYISSNFQAIRKEDIDKILDSKLDFIIISMDSAISETYKYLRFPGELENLMANIRCLTEKKAELKTRYPLVTLQFVISRYNEHEIDLMKKMAKDLRVDFIDLLPIAYVEKKHLPNNQRFIRTIYQTIKKRNDRTCWWQWNNLTIGWNGTVFPCCIKIFDTGLGSIFSQDSSGIWNSEKYAELRRNKLTTFPDTFPCRNCEFLQDRFFGII